MIHLSVVQQNPVFLIVELLAAITILIKQAGNLAATLAVTLKKFQHLKKTFK